MKDLVKGMENIETLIMKLQQMLDKKRSDQYLLQPTLSECFCRAAIDEWVNFRANQKSTDQPSKN